MNCDCPACASWWQTYWDHPLDRRHTLKIIAAGLATLALLAIIGFLIYP